MPNVMERTKYKERRKAQSKRARAGSLAIIDKPQVARIQAFLFVDAILSFSDLAFFVVVLFVLPSLNPQPLVQSLFDWSGIGI